MAEKLPQESFLAQLSEVDHVTTMQPGSGRVEVVSIDPVYAHKVDNSGLSGNHLKSEQAAENVYQAQKVQVPMAAAPVFVSTPASSQSANANGESAARMQNSPRTPNSTPQTVTGNVKIQLMEISVDEFKSNVEYIQQQFPSLPRRLVCDAFSKANFDSRVAMDLLAKEQEKKDQTIVPPLVLAAAAAAASASKQQQQPPQLPRLPKTAQPPQQQQPAASPTTPQTPQRQQTPRGRRWRGAAVTVVAADAAPASAAAAADVTSPNIRVDEQHQPGYRRVASGDKEVERVLRQKLKSNVRSRVFNHGVKIAQGRETAANIFQQQKHHHPHQAKLSADADSSTTHSEDASAIVPTSPGLIIEQTAPQAEAAVDEEEDADKEKLATEEPMEKEADNGTPQSAMRILRDSFPGLDEARLAEALDACDQDVDAAIRSLASSGGSGGGSARFFKSRAQAARVQQVRKGYVRAELSTGAWMDHRTASAVGRAAAAAAGANKTAPPPVPVKALRVFTVQPRRKIKKEKSLPNSK